MGRMSRQSRTVEGSDPRRAAFFFNLLILSTFNHLKQSGSSTCSQSACSHFDKSDLRHKQNIKTHEVHHGHRRRILPLQHESTLQARLLNLFNFVNERTGFWSLDILNSEMPTTNGMEILAAVSGEKKTLKNAPTRWSP
jgi:hypothetical protein